LIHQEDSVTAKASKHPRHIPQRTCVGCHSTQEKRSLIRIVYGPQGILLDPTGKAPGRGAYLHNQRSCWQTALKGALAHALKVEFTEQDRALIQEYMQRMPEESPDLSNPSTR